MSLATSTDRAPSVDAWAAALCRNFDPEVWFPVQSDRATAAEAKQICGKCPLRKPCLEVGWRNEYGIFGGLDEKERRKIRRRQLAHAGRAVA